MALRRWDSLKTLIASLRAIAIIRRHIRNLENMMGVRDKAFLSIVWLGQGTPFLLMLNLWKLMILFQRKETNNPGIKKEPSLIA